MIALRQIRFTFDGSPAFDGFDIGGEWNGAANVAVTPEVRGQIADWLRQSGEDDAADELASLPATDGLVSLADGWTAQIVGE